MVKKTKENLQEGAGLFSKLKDKFKRRQYQQIRNNNSSNSTINTKPNQANNGLGSSRKNIILNNNLSNNVKRLTPTKIDEFREVYDLLMERKKPFTHREINHIKNLIILANFSGLEKLKLTNEELLLDIRNKINGIQLTQQQINTLPKNYNKNNEIKLNLDNLYSFILRTQVYKQEDKNKWNIITPNNLKRLFPNLQSKTYFFKSGFSLSDLTSFFKEYKEKIPFIIAIDYLIKKYSNQFGEIVKLKELTGLTAPKSNLTSSNLSGKIKNVKNTLPKRKFQNRMKKGFITQEYLHELVQKLKSQGKSENQISTEIEQLRGISNNDIKKNIETLKQKGNQLKEFESEQKEQIHNQIKRLKQNYKTNKLTFQKKFRQIYIDTNKDNWDAFYKNGLPQIIERYQQDSHSKFGKVKEVQKFFDERKYKIPLEQATTEFQEKFGLDLRFYTPNQQQLSAREGLIKNFIEFARKRNKGNLSEEIDKSIKLLGELNEVDKKQFYSDLAQLFQVNNLNNKTLKQKLFELNYIYQRIHNLNIIYKNHFSTNLSNNSSLQTYFTAKQFGKDLPFGLVDQYFNELSNAINYSNKEQLNTQFKKIENKFKKYLEQERTGSIKYNSTNKNYNYETKKIQKILDSLNKNRAEKAKKFIEKLHGSPTNKILKDLVQKIDYYGKQNEIRFNELILEIGNLLNEDQREQVFSLVRRYKHKAVSFPFILIHIKEKLEKMLRNSNKKDNILGKIDNEYNLSQQKFTDTYCQDKTLQECKTLWENSINDVRIPECLDDAVLDIINNAPINERRKLKKMLNNAKKELINKMKEPQPQENWGKDFGNNIGE